VLIACVPARRWLGTNTADGPAGCPLARCCSVISRAALTLDSDARDLLWRGESSATVDPISSQCLLPSPLGCGPKASPATPPCCLTVRAWNGLTCWFSDLVDPAINPRTVEQRYGLSPALSERLAARRFVLRIKPLPRAPVSQASLDLPVAAGKTAAPGMNGASLREALRAQADPGELPGEAKPADQTLPEEQTSLQNLTKATEPPPSRVRCRP